MLRRTVPCATRFPAASAVVAASLFALAVTAPASPASAQDRFGAAVALAGDELVVHKPGAGRGPAGVLVYRHVDGAWRQVSSLEQVGRGRPGESFGPGMAAAPGVVVVSAGDPDGRWGGHLYRRDTDGWTGTGRIGLTAGVEDAGRDGNAGGGAPGDRLSWASLLQIMSPPDRTVALGPHGAVVATAAVADGAGTVRVGTLGPDGRLRDDALLRPTTPEEGDPTPLGGFGAALAVARDRVAVGAPSGDSAGVVVVFARDAGGAWSQEAVLTAPALGKDGALGAALAFPGGRGDELLAGAPGAGAVVRFVRDAGGWRQDGLLWPPDRSAGADARDGSAGPAGTRFGASFGATAALPDEVWVGAPGDGRTTGRAYRFLRTAGNARNAADRPAAAVWRPAGELSADDLGPGARLGAALAMSADLLAVGAPGATGSAGTVAVLRREGDGWGAPAWLEAETPFSVVRGGEVRCADGDAAGFDCSNVDLLAFLPLEALGAAPGERVSDLWGWTDGETGREYALVGRTAGMAIVDVSDPTAPAVLALVPGNPSGARDIKVYRDHAFFVGDGAGEHGLRVFDLTRVRSLARPASPGQAPLLEADAVYDRVASAHNLVIDTESGFAFTVGTNTGGESCGGGLHMIDIREPLSPIFAGCYTDSEGLIWQGRTHDAQCTVYRGPDEEFRGRQICFASNETALRVVDVTDKAAPVPLAAVRYPGMAYVHQGWLTEDHRYFYMNDEVDELVGTTDRTRTLIWDVEELEDPVLVGELLGPDNATDHNLYIRGDRAYLANYQAGFRVVDVSDPLNPVEVGHFDTTPYGANPAGFGGGAWTAYPFFDSGTVAVSSINEGLFLLRPRRIIP